MAIVCFRYINTKWIFINNTISFNFIVTKNTELNFININYFFNVIFHFIFYKHIFLY